MRLLSQVFKQPSNKGKDITYSLHNDVGHVGRGKPQRGLLAHSVLLFAPQAQHLVGLIEQSRWSRDIKTMGKRKQHANIPYEDKEGYQWESASRAMSPRLKEQMSKVISVCDREADIYEYLQYKLTEQQRFVVRSMQSRHIGEDYVGCAERGNPSSDLNWHLLEQ